MVQCLVDIFPFLLLDRRLDGNVDVCTHFKFLRARIQTDIHTHTHLLLQHMRAIFRSKNVYKIKLMTKLMPIAHQTQVTRRFFFIDFISKVKQSPKVN